MLSFRPVAAVYHQQKARLASAVSALFGTSNNRLQSLQQVYAEVTGLARVTKAKDVVSQSYSKLKQRREDMRQARTALQQTEMAFRNRQHGIRSEIEMVERDPTLSHDYKEKFFTQKHGELQRSDERSAFLRAEKEYKEAEASLETGNEDYADALREQHDAETAWNNARTVLVAYSTISSLLLTLIVTPAITMATTGYRVQKAVDKAVDRMSELIRQSIQTSGVAQQNDSEAVPSTSAVVQDGSGSESIVALTAQLQELTSELQRVRTTQQQQQQQQSLASMPATMDETPTDQRVAETISSCVLWFVEIALQGLLDR